MTIEAGMELYRAGEFSAAADVFREVVKNDPNDSASWNALGICHSKTGDYKEANRCFERATLLEPVNKTYQNNLEVNKRKLPFKDESETMKGLSLDNEKPAPVKSQNDPSQFWKDHPVMAVIVFIFIVIIAGSAIMNMATGPSSHSISATNQKLTPEVQDTSNDITTSDINDGIFVYYGSEFFKVIGDCIDGIVRASETGDFEGFVYYSQKGLEEVRSVREMVTDLEVSDNFKPVYPDFLDILDQTERTFSLINQGGNMAISGDYTTATNKLTDATRELTRLNSDLENFNTKMQEQTEKIKK